MVEKNYLLVPYPVIWEKIFVDTVKLEYSTDGGSTWIMITENAFKSTLPVIHPKKKIESVDVEDEIESSSQYDWIIPNTISNDCLVRASDKNDPAVFDISDSIIFNYFCTISNYGDCRLQVLIQQFFVLMLWILCLHGQEQKVVKYLKQQMEV